MAIRPKGILKVHVRREDGSVSVFEQEIAVYQNENYDGIMLRTAKEISREGLRGSQCKDNHFFPPHMITSVSWADENTSQGLSDLL